MKDDGEVEGEWPGWARGESDRITDNWMSSAPDPTDTDGADRAEARDTAQREWRAR
jgi:hypothetical protein